MHADKHAHTLARNSCERIMQATPRTKTLPPKRPNLIKRVWRRAGPVIVRTRITHRGLQSSDGWRLEGFQNCRRTVVVAHQETVLGDAAPQLH